MTYSSFDPSKIQIDNARSDFDATSRLVEQYDKEEAAKYLEEAEEKEKQAPKEEPQEPEVPEDTLYQPAPKDMPKWRQSLDEGEANPDLTEGKGLSLGQRAQIKLDDLRAVKSVTDPSQFGLTENTLEFFDAIKSGARKTLGSIVTFPERVIDMSTGAYQREVEETGTYKADSDLLGLTEYDPQLKTWWGKLTEMGVHFTGLAGAVKAIPGVGAQVAKGGVGADIGVGFVSDVISSTSQEGNLTQEVYESKIVERIPWMGEFLNRGVSVLATKDSDHPWVKTFKNAFEGMGADFLVGSVLRKFAGGDSLEIQRRADIEGQKTEAANAKTEELQGKAKQANSEIKQGEARLQQLQEKIDAMPEGPDRDAIQSTFDQIKRNIEARKQEVDKGEFSAYVNRDMADPWQGAPNSRPKSTFDAAQQARRLDEMWPNSGGGSTDSVFTPAQATRMSTQNGMLGEEMHRIAKKLLSDSQYQDIIKEAKKNKQTFEEVFSYAFERMQETIGRDATAINAEDFWKPIMDEVTFRTGGRESMEAWAMENVVAADLVNASLFSQLRDLGLASREVFDIADVMDTDGPMKTIAERLIVGLSNVKRSRYLISTEFQKLKGPAAKKALAERDATFRAESEAAVNMFMEFARKSDDDRVVKALVEAFSMSNKIQNWKDLDAYMKQRIRNFGLEGDAGIVVKELQTVMMHSILSGPKTSLRAMSGTFTSALLRPMNTAVGASMRGDWDSARANMASVNAFFQTIPEAFQLFKTNLNAYWAGDVATVQTRFSEARTKSDDQWALYEHWVDTRGSEVDGIAFGIANTARKLNDNKLLTYSTSVMGATDDAFTLIMARARSREKALRVALEQQKKGRVSDISPKMLQTYEDHFYKDLLDADGNISIESDLYLKSIVKEATLTQDLSGITQGLEQLFTRFPFTKPFFLFARTGINGLNFSYKTSPMLGLLHKNSIDIMRASPDDLSLVTKYGINTAEDLANAKSLLAGRQAIGSAITLMASMHYMNGNLTGNGPQDRRMRKLWMDTGYPPRSIKLGNVWVSYDTFEPFNTIFAAIADIGDNMKLMGPQWAEQNVGTVALAVMGTATSKSFLQGLGQLVDVFSNEEKQLEKIAGNIINNTVPLAGLRNEIGKVINPYMREINNSISESIRNRNLSSELIFASDEAEPLPIKYDILNGKPIRDWNFMERMWNAVSPINLQMEDGPGRNLLWNSKYDIRPVTYTAPPISGMPGLPLDDHPKIRSLFQQEMGKLNMEAELDKLAARPDVQASVERMEKDLDDGKRHLDPMLTYMHNRLIKDRFDRARVKAWAAVRRKYPNLVEPLYQEEKERRAEMYRTLRETQGRLMPNI